MEENAEETLSLPIPDTARCLNSLKKRVVLVMSQNNVSACGSESLFLSSKGKQNDDTARSMGWITIFCALGKRKQCICFFTQQVRHVGLAAKDLNCYPITPYSMNLTLAGARSRDF